MSHWTDIRVAASRYHELLIGNTLDYTGEDLLEAAEKHTQIKRAGLPSDHPLLDGGEAVLDLEANVIWYNEDADPYLVTFYQAHEFGHFWIHSESFWCNANDIDPSASEDPVPLGVDRVEGYSPHERREREANVFAREFLLPSKKIREKYFTDQTSAKLISSGIGIPEGMVFHQMSRALLIDEQLKPEAKSTKSGETSSIIQLDKSQERAAYELEGPTLIEAGPGTGKTRTLTARISFLLEQNINPNNILALTFSNKAAEEMRERIGKVCPEQAPLLWMGTFHAFGIELLRKYHTAVGLPPTPKVLDPIDAAFLLEDSLTELRLEYYQNLYDPGSPLRDILSAISRAKDELVSPLRYKELSEAMLAKAEIAANDQDILKAKKAQEVARVYAFYQEYLQTHGMVDFGDLIYRSVLLLRENDDVRLHVQESYEHILVDEYQDVNRASGLFLKEIAGDGKGLWVVGDTRQAIYRFRGASTANMLRFSSDFQAKNNHTLTVNYRSQEPIVEVFSELAPQMSATPTSSFQEWDIHRGTTDGYVINHVAENDIAEGRGIASTVKDRLATGIPLREQVILCRSHTLLARISATLEEEGVPVLYLGDVFERPEIRDMLSIIALVSEPDGKALVRVGQFPEYNIPLADIKILREKAKGAAKRFPEALAIAETDIDISEEGKEGFRRLAQHVAGVHFKTSPWRVLAEYLLCNSQYISGLLQDDSASTQQKRLALYQLFQFSHEFREHQIKGGEDPKRAFLQYIRRLASSGEDRQLRQVPEWADGIDAVRLLTIHASKGLEFDTVYIPALATAYFPAGNKKRLCPPPEGMIPEEEQGNYMEEEECLFFVALSRARNVLCLSRAEKYGKVNRKPSSLISFIESSVPGFVNAKPTWLSSTNDIAPTSTKAPGIVNSPSSRTFEERTLSVYVKCPLRYHYSFNLDLIGWDDESVYLQFHRCVYKTLRNIHEQSISNGSISLAEAIEFLKGHWEKSGPTDHAYESYYWQNANQIISRALSRVANNEEFSDRPEWVVELDSGSVSIRPESVIWQKDRNSRRIQRWRTGRPTKSEADKPIYALLHRAAQTAHPEGYDIEIVFLSTNDVQPSQMTKKKVETRLAKYDAAMHGIISQDFPANPSDRECPKCPFYFICPAA